MQGIIKMKKLFCVLSLSLSVHILMAQNISGRITDAATGKPVPSASVEMERVGGVITGISGAFSFGKSKPGHYALHISSIGYRALDTIVAAGEPAIIRLQPLQLFMQPVEVTAIRAGDRAPFTKSDLSKKDIEAVNLGQDLPLLLAQTPSAVVNSDAGNGVGYTGIRIRGTDLTRTNVTLNGIPYNDAESLGTFFVDLPDFASSVNSIQIQRGVGTSSNGGGAFGATINFSTNEVNTSPYGEINTSYGSFNTWKHTVKAGSGLIDGHFTIDARLSKISSNGYIDRGSSNLRAFYLSGAWMSNRTSIRLNVLSGKEKTYQAWNGISEARLRSNLPALQTHYANNQGVLYFTAQDSINLFRSNPRTYNYFTYPNQTDNYQQDHYQLFVNHRLREGLDFNTAFFYTRGKGYFEEFKNQRTYRSYGLPNFVVAADTLRTTDLVQQQWLDNKFYGQILSLQYRNDRNDLLTVGGGWNRYDGKHFGNVIWATAGIPKDYQWYNRDAYKTDLNGYAKYQFRLVNHVSAFADMQYRRVLYNIAGFRDNPFIHIHNIYNFYNPKAGITYADGPIQLYASYSLAHKEPNRDDVEASPAQQPKPEVLHDAELGFSRRSPRWGWGVTAYYMYYRNQLVLTGKINDVGAYTRINVPKSYRLGIELEGNANITDWMQAMGNITLSNNRIENFTEYYDDYDNGGQKSIAHGTTDIALSPSVVAAAALRIMPVKNGEIRLPAKYVGRQYLDNTSSRTRSLDPYYVQDMQLSYTLKNLWFRETRFSFQVNNIFNRKYEPNGYTYSYQYGGQLITENFYFPMAGTNFMAAVNIRL